MLLKNSLARFIASFMLLLCSSSAFAAGENISGKWSPVIGLPLVPSSGAVLPNGKVLLWSADGEFSFGSGGQVFTTLFDPATNTSSPKIFQGGHNMFCTGTTNLVDGRILVNGGSQERATTIYDPATNLATRVQDMNQPRGYNSNTILPDGSILTLGGSWSGGLDDKKGEIWTPATGWRTLPELTTRPIAPDSVPGFARDSHMWLAPAGNGRVFYAGPAPNMQWLDTNGNGAIRPAGARGDDIFASQGATVMYDRGQLLKVGGSPEGSGSPGSASAYKIDIRNGVSVSKLAPMTYPRVFNNSVVLPDGNVFIVGGQTYGASFADSDAVFPTELWNASTGNFAITAPVAVPRVYHSIAMLLPDGRVLSGGGGLCGGCTTNHPDLQIYSPGYLFDAAGALKPRPAITSAPAELPYGRTITVQTDRDVTAFSIVRVGSTTHTVNNDQRRLPLSFVKTGTNVYQLSVPSNPGWLLPGNWMLFAMDAAGTPSVARIVRVNVNPVARLSAEPIYGFANAASVSIQPSITRVAANATLSISGLPAGLSFNAQTGAITGVASSPGSFPVILSATDGTQTVSVEFLIAIERPSDNGSGLRADYFATTDLSGAITASRVETPWFADNTVGAGAGVNMAIFSARWSGEIVAQRTGATSIRTRSDDGVRVWIGGKLIIDDWNYHAAEFREGAVDLVEGVRYPIYVEYFNDGGDGVMQLSWQRPGDTTFSPIPTSQLYPGLPFSTNNLARGKAATQSSTFGSAAAALAVDGVVNGAFSAGSVSHTNADDNPWWQVDLGASADIGRIRLWNRTDCCGERLQNFHVFISNQNMTGRSLMQILADPSVIHRTVSASRIPTNITIQGGVSGRFVRVQLAQPDFLQLAEVEVFGETANLPPTFVGAPASAPMIIGSPFSLQLAATDPEGQAVTFTATGAPPGLSVSPTGLISGAPTSIGDGVMTIAARDASGLSSTASISWTVIAGLPSVSALTVTPAAVGATVTYAPTIVNGTGATYSWNFGDGAPATAFSATAATSHVFTTAGVKSVTLIMRAVDGRQTTYSFNQPVFTPVPAGPRARSSSGAAYEARATGSPRLWVANPDNDSVGVIDLATNRLAAEIGVGRRPVSVGIHPTGDIWVVNRDSATISIVNPATLSLRRTVALPPASRPYGLVFAGTNGVVTLEAAESVALVDATGAVLGTATVGRSPRHIAVNSAENGALISRFITPPLPGEGTATVRTTDATGKPVGGEVIEINGSGRISRSFVLRHSEALDTEVSARGIPNYLGAPAVSPDGKFAWIPSKQDNIKRGMLRDGRQLDFQTTVRAIVSRINLSTGQEDLASRVDLDNSGVASAALFHPSGAWLFVALQTSREVAVVDPVAARELFRFAVGRAPSNLTLSPDGATLYVTNFMDRTVTRVSLAPMLTKGLNAVTVSAVIPSITTEKLNATVLKGKQFFYDAADTRLARDGYLSCAACHDNAEQDGRVWDFTGFGEGLRNTISLEGRAGIGHGFLHWSANFDEAQDFEGQIRNFAQGTGLMTNAAFNTGTRAQPLGDRKTGLSADLDALAAYLASRTVFPQSPWRNWNGTLTPAAAAGKNAFAARGCANCHAGGKMTISGDATRLRNVGTIKPSSGKRLNGSLPGLDVPTLLGVFATAPYLHDGSAATLDDAVRAHTNVTLTATEVANISAYLRQIGSAP